MLDLDPNRASVQPKPAATVVVLSGDDEQLELFCVRRHQKSGFLGGAVVFPGGKVDEADFEPEWQTASTGLSSRAGSVAENETEALAMVVAASRELLEESAILPVVGDGLDDAAIGELREAWFAESAQSASFAEFLKARSLVLDTKRLEVFARWVTPTSEAKRYDTRFYVMRLPAGQRGRHDRKETVESFWASPGDVTKRWERNEIFLAPPTSRTLTVFGKAKTVDSALSVARNHPLEPICPFLTMDTGETILALPGDPLFPEKHPPPADTTAPTRFVLRDGRFVEVRAE